MWQKLSLRARINLLLALVLTLGLAINVARLVLEAAYEATLMAGALNAARPDGSPQVLLTRLGGGAFGNAPAWIDAAIERAITLADGLGLHVLHVAR